MTASDRRVLLLEFVNADQFPGRVSTAFPLIAGYLDEVGADTRWIRFAVSTTNLLEHGRDEITLSAADFAALERVVAEHRPQLVVQTDTLFSGHVARLRAGSPELEFVAEKEFEGLAGECSFVGTSHLDRPGFVPRYAWEIGNEAAARKDIDNIYLRIRERCGHQLWIGANPHYDGIDDPRVQRHAGCAFCGSWSTGHDSHRTAIRSTPLDWITRQVHAIATSRGLPERFPNALLFETLARPEMLRACLESMEETGMAGRVQILVAVRTSQIPRVAALLEDHIRASPESRIRLGVYATGIESFAASDLSLFNKGTTPLDGLRAVSTLREMAERYPERFWYTGLSFLLLTPWTTLETLQLNVALIRLLGLTREDAGNLFQSRLRLHPDLPLTCLAEREGLLLEQESDPILLMNRRKLFGNERAWRFRDPRLRPLSRIILRYDLLGTALGDELARDIERHMRVDDPMWNPGHDRELLDYLLSAIDATRAAPEVLDERELLARASAIWTASREARASAPAPRRFRVGERRVDLHELLEAIGKLVASGLRPVLSVDGVGKRDLDARVAELLRRLGLVRALVPRRAAQRVGEGTLIVAAHSDVLQRAIALAHAVDHAADAAARRVAAAEEGRLHGHPECCALAFAESAFPGLGLRAWAAFASRCGTPGAVPALVNPLMVPSAAFVPCAASCVQAAAQYGALTDALDGPVPRASTGTAYVFGLDGDGDGDLVALRVLESDERSLLYSPDSISPGDEPVRALLRAGERLEFLPGQIRVLAAGQLVDVLTATHAVWYASRCWDAEAWRELARGAAFAARTRLLERLALAAPEGIAVDGARPEFELAEGATASRFPRWVRGVLERAARGIERHTGFSALHVAGDEQRVRVRLARGAVELKLIIERATASSRPFRRGRFFAVNYDQSTRIDSEDKTLAVKLLHAALERSAGAARRRTHAGGPPGSP